MILYKPVKQKRVALSRLVSVFFGVSILSSCSDITAGEHRQKDHEITQWITTGDQAKLLEEEPAKLLFADSSSSGPVIEVDTAKKYQAMQGFGFALTGGSAYLINHLPAAIKESLLQELFGQSDSSVHISYLRISIGASDLNESVFSYDDLPAGQTDTSLAHFNLSKDTVDMVPLLKQILAINPSVKIMGSPWSAPVWMKDNRATMGGSLLPAYYHAYAGYFVKYIQAMQLNGIAINSITIQNEPQYGGNNPSMVMSADQQGTFIKNHLGPAFQSAGITTKILIWDHNCNQPGYPISILNDADARKYIDGSAFHLYEGEIEALSEVHKAHPDKNLYFTEQWTGAKESFSDNLQWHVKNVMIGSVRNWATAVIEWNLASDPSFNPHTPGGCSECKGALTIAGEKINRNPSYYIVAQVSKFVPPGSVRIESNNENGIYSAAFVTPAGKKVLVLMNDSRRVQNFSIRYNGLLAPASLEAGAAGTYTWD